MKKRIFTLALALVLLVGMLPFGAQAADTAESIVYLEDGSYMVVVLKTEDGGQSNARATETVVATRTYSYYNSSDELLWEASLTASFAFNGFTSVCGLSSVSATSYHSSWYKISATASHVGHTATANVTMGYKLLGIKLNEMDCTITISCDANGNIT